MCKEIKAAINRMCKEIKVAKIECVKKLKLLKSNANIISVKFAKICYANRILNQSWQFKICNQNIKY